MPFLPQTRISDRYQISEFYAQGGMSLVYKGLDIKTNQPVAVKVLKSDLTSERAEDVIRFRREALTIAKLNHPHLVKIHEVGQYQQAHYLVMELVDGLSLTHYLVRRALSLPETVAVITQVVEALDYVHGHGVVHRDLKPANIMVTGQEAKDTNLSVKLLDFGLAQVMELIQIKEPEAIVGTFSYMSPEQSGIIKKPVDERSDLYSLGIVFYQLCTGQLPFKGEEVGTILHQQVAKLPTPPRQLNKDVPQIIEDIILRLLKKDPAQRYQTAQGLLADLKRYARAESSFALGRDDHLTKLTYRTRLIGREEEMARLEQLYAQARQGQGSVCFISGPAGRGKSRLVDEFRGYVYQEEGEVVAGRCFAQENKIPYQPFAESLNEYLSQGQGLSAEQNQGRLTRMQQSLGQLGEIVCQLNPLMRDLLGQLPELVELDSERANRRFLVVCSRFFRQLGQPDKPVVLILDDLQWADEGTLTLLKEIAEEIASSPLLVLALYRDNEVTPEHSLSQIIEESEQKNFPHQKIPVTNFDIARLSRLLSELLLEEEAKTKELAEYIHGRSQGNPFFTLEIVRQLVAEKVLEYKQDQWQIDRQKLSQVTVSATILEILLKRIEGLSPEQLELFSSAAVIGREFEIDLLYRLSQLAQERITNLVDEGIQAQLLEKGSVRGDLLFVHDRIRDAFYHRIGEPRKKELHAKIAQALEELHQDNPVEVLFDLAHHYTAAGLSNKSLQYALPAADQAKRGCANQEAINYYLIAIENLEAGAQEATPPWVQAQEGLAEVYITTGRYDEAIAASRKALPLKKTPLEKARIYRYIGSAYFKKGDWLNTEEALTQGATLLGETIPRSRLQVRCLLAKELFIHTLHCLFPAAFRHKPGRPVRPQDLELMWYFERFGWLRALTDLEKFLCSILRGVNVAEARLSKSRELGMAIGGYACLCMAIPLFKRALVYHHKALAIEEELEDLGGIAQCLQWLGYCYQWQGEQQKSFDYLKQSLDKFQAIGDMWETTKVTQGLAFGYTSQSNYAEALEWWMPSLENSQRMKDNSSLIMAQQAIAVCYIEQGDFTEAEQWINKALALSKEQQDKFTLCISYIQFGYLQSERGNYQKAIECFEQAQQLDQAGNFLREFTFLVYPYLANAYIDYFLAVKRELQPASRKSQLRKIRRAAQRALAKTKAWPNRHGDALRAYARYLILVGRNKPGKTYFRRAMAQITRVGRKYELARIIFEYANFLQAQGRIEEARQNWQRAYELARQIGAKLYIQKTAACLDLKPSTTQTTQERLSDRRELASVITVSHHLSSILELDVLLEKIMDASLEVTGAERGFLFLYSAGKAELEITVARNVDKDSFKGEEFAVSRTVIKRVEKTQDAQIVMDAAEDKGLKDKASVVIHGLRSILCVPLITRDRLLGVVYVDNRQVGGLFSEQKLELLKTLSVQAAISIENARLYQEVQEKARMEEELRLGRQIQTNLLPHKFPQVEGIKVSGLMIPAREIGGDYYDFITLKQAPHKLNIVIADVSGKGVAAGLIMATAKATLYSLSRQLMSPKQLLAQANEVLHEYTQGQKFLTMLCLQWNAKNKQISYSSAGHERLIIYRKHKVETIPGGGVMLGALPDVADKLEEKRLAVSSGDKVILYTDGVTEARNSKGEFYGVARLTQTVDKYAPKPLNELITLIKQDVDDFIGSQAQHDDITLVALQIV